MDPDALDRLAATIETLLSLYERAKDEGDPDALAKLPKQCQAALDELEQLRSR